MSSYVDRSVITSSPRQIQIEITTRCNFACVMCPHGTGLMPSNIDAPDELVTEVIRHLDTVDTIHPTGTGEPLMADGFWKIVDSVQGRSKPKISFHTNGLLLTKSNIRRLSLAPISHVVLSMDAATDVTYSKIRGGPFDKIVRNGTEFAEVMSAAQPNTLLQLAMVVMAENFREAPEFVRLAHAMGYKAVSFDQMTNPNSPPGSWVVSRDDFVFDYHKQWILPDTEYARECDAAMIAALDVADELGIHVFGLNIFNHVNPREHNSRPSRKIASGHYQ
jgi:MoaA/NifB/PqqE/SkfB family radical SAM enzyme